MSNGRVTQSGTRFRGENERGFREFFDTREEAQRFANGEQVTDQVTQERRGARSLTRDRGRRGMRSN